MSTTPSTPERPGLSYTVVGGTRSDRILSAPLRASLLLLNRGSRFDRGDALREATALKVDEVISVERGSVEVDNLSREHPEVRFLLVPETRSPGELIDIGMTESRSRLVVVLWSDMRVVSPEALEGALEAAERSGALCVAPEPSGQDGSAIPAVASPVVHRGRFGVGHAPAASERCATLYPFDYCGIYCKERFLGMGGYDGLVASPYWQKVHLGLLAHLWGESIELRRDFRVAYRVDLAPEDTTPDPAYRRFYLRTVAVRLAHDGAYLPIARFLSFLARSGTRLATALGEFREARRWVAEHRKHYRHDTKGLVEAWGNLR